MKTAFRTAFSGQKRKHVPTGNGKYWEYEEYINDDGEKLIRKTKEIDRYANIQEFKDECLIENIMKRAECGDMSAFRNDAKYIDTTVIPKSILEAYMMTHELQKEFNNLPLEERIKFGNDFGKFLFNAGMKTEETPLEGEKEPQKTAETAPPNVENSNTGKGDNNNA